MFSNSSLVVRVSEWKGLGGGRQYSQEYALSTQKYQRKKTSALVVKVHGWFIFSFYLNLCQKEVTLSHEVVSISIKPLNKCVKMLLNWDLLEKMSSQ